MIRIFTGEIKAKHFSIADHFLFQTTPRIRKNLPFRNGFSNRCKTCATNQNEIKNIYSKFAQYVFSLVSNVTDYIEKNKLAKRMWGKYLHNEWKYDKFGAQGKLVLLQEILLEKGFNLQPGIDYQKMINEIFPRTFYCLNPREVNPPLANTILKYFRKLEREFTEQGLPEAVVRYICVLEAAEKFCLQVNTVKKIANQS